MSEVAGQSPVQSPESLDLPPDPPSWPKVIGIISIVLGSLGLVCGGCGTIMTPFLPKLMEMGAPGQEVPPVYAGNFPMLGAGVLGILNALLLLIAGAMLIRRRPVARPLHLVYAILALPLVAISLWLQRKMQIDLVAWAQTAPPDNLHAQRALAPGAGLGSMIGLLFGAALGLGYPIFLLVWFGAVKRKASDMGQLPEYL